MTSLIPRPLHMSLGTRLVHNKIDSTHRSLLGLIICTSMYVGR